MAGGTLEAGTTLIVLPFVFEQTASARLFSLLGLWALVPFLLEINRRGRPALASWGLILGMIAIVTHRAWTLGGIEARATPFYVIFVMVAGVRLGTRGGILTAVLCIACGLGLVVAGHVGALPPPTLVLPSNSLLLHLVMFMALTLLLQWLIVRSLRRALGRAEEALAQRQRAQLRLRLALEAGKIGLWEQDAVTRSFHADARMLDLYGLVDEGTGVAYREWVARVHADDVAEVQAKLERLGQGVEREAHADYRNQGPR